MATVKQRVHRMNESGSYDTIYYETSSEVVIRPDGTTVEQTIQNGLGNNTLLFEGVNVPASLWTTSTNSDYAYQATITGLTGVTVNHYPQIVFSASDISNYGLSQEVVSGNSSVTIYADTKPTSAITIITASFTTMNPGNNITLDSTPTQNSVNAVTSNGIYNAISELAETAGNPAELWVWEKFNYTPESYHDGETHTNETMLKLDTYDSEVTFYYSDSISVNEIGTVSLINPSALYLSYSNYSSANVLKGKYIKKIYSSQISFIPTTATFSRTTSNGRYLVVVSTVKDIVGVAAVFSHTEYLSSPNSSTYPEDSQSGDYWYTRLGQIGEGMTKIETGSYVGTGTYGSSNPNSLTFAFVPKVVFIYPEEPSQNASGVVAVYGTIYAIDYGTHQDISIIWADKQMSWYSSSAPIRQFNDINVNYIYVAIG